MNSILKNLVKHPIVKKVWIFLAAIIILGAIFSSIFRALTPWAEQHKGEVEQKLSQLLNETVTIQTMETGWYWVHPVIKLKDVTLNDGKETPIHVQKLYIGIHILQSLLKWKLQPSLIYVDTVHLEVKKDQDQWHLVGSNVFINPKTNLNKSEDLLVWLANQNSLILKHISLDFYLSPTNLFRVRDLKLSITNGGGNYKLKGQANLLQKQKTSFKFSGGLQFNPFHQENTKGQLYFASKNMVPAEWKTAIPAIAQYVEGGHGDLALWMDINNGKISSIQSQLKFNQLALHFKENAAVDFQALSANLIWNPTATGWKFQADKVHLLVNGVLWPENQLALQFDKELQAYHLFVKTILIKPLLSLQVDWPSYIQNLEQFNPEGQLTDSQLVLKNNQPTYVLTRFKDLAWKTKDMQVDNVSGVLNWQPQEGRLELDSEDTHLQIKGYPGQQLSLLNGAFEWKQLSNGLRLSVDRFVLNQPNLTLSLEAVLDEVTKDSLGHMTVNADFSGNHIQRWISYIPSGVLKPKLDDWLKNDLKGISKASGKIHLNGMAHDFPFDNHNGEFTITSHVLGGKLYISPQWQLISDIEGNIEVKNRNLNIDIVHADFHGVPVKRMGLKIEDIGKNQEKLLIQGQVQAGAEKIQSFVMASPLQNKLWTLKSLSLQNPLLLQLSLEIPLYKDAPPMTAEGYLNLKNNTLLFHHNLEELKLEDLTGILNFNEKGLTESTLTASGLGYPLNIKIHDNKGEKPYTSILVDGKCSIDAIKNHYNWHFLSFLKGGFLVQSELRLMHEEQDFVNLTLKSDLKGLAIRLPAPLGKPYETSVPLEVNLDFKKGIRLQASYDEHLSADIKLKEKKGVYSPYSGQIRLGSKHALDQKLPGIAIVGALDDFDLPAWSEVISQVTKENKSLDLMHHLRIIHVSLEKLTFLDQPFNNIALKAKMLPDKSWSFNIKQKNIAGDLVYQPKDYFLSGYITHLHLLPFEKTKMSSLHPKQIPNLNLRIEDLSLGSKNIGNMTLKSQSTRERWLIQYCRIESPFYQLNVTGDWIQKNKTNKTNMALNLQIQNLGKSLERWNIAPAVDANHGEMEFQGGWNDGLMNFSLAALNGEMSLTLKNGVITNLSPEAEGKLGLGKLLSILSLQTIPRRLKLDFSDLSQKGFTFDEFRGHFIIHHGIMKTLDSNLDGPVASASMRGNLDLVNRMYDLYLEITPHITASLPVVATIAGGPVAGVAMWIANKMIINQGMQKISGYTYKISGPWSQPIVQQLKIIRGQ